MVLGKIRKLIQFFSFITELAFIEGDIVLDQGIEELLKPRLDDEHRREKRDTVANSINLWPEGLVPYTIEDSVGKITKCVYVVFTCKISVIKPWAHGIMEIK